MPETFPNAFVNVVNSQLDKELVKPDLHRVGDRMPEIKFRFEQPNRQQRDQDRINGRDTSPRHTF